MLKKPTLIGVFVALLTSAAAFAQQSLASRVLVVYVANDTDSSAVAQHYRTMRGVPAANLCPLTLLSPGSSSLSLADYSTYIRGPVQNCLNSVGPTNILYILMAYTRPLDVTLPSGNFHAIDSYLSDIWNQYTTSDFDTIPRASHRYYADSQSLGNFFVPFQSFASFRASSRAQLIYSVWRLDGPTAAIANAQLDNVLAAEAAGGPPVSSIGASKTNACVDMTYSPIGAADSSYATANWDLYRATEALTLANNMNVLTDTLGSVFGVSPSASCPNTGLYVGWYNYGSYNDAFTWDKGSIGWDLDSGALFDPRGGVWWGSGAIARGVSVTSGPVTEPYLVGLPRPAVVRNLLEGANVGDAFLRNTRWLKWQIVNVGDPLYQPFPGGVPPFSGLRTENSLAFFEGQGLGRQITGGNPIVAKISLSAAAASPMTFNLTSSSSIAVFPASVTIPAGQSSVTFSGTTSAVLNGTDVFVTATSGSLTLTNTMSVYPYFAGLGFSNLTVQGGSTVNGAAFLNASAPLAGAVVQMSSDQPKLASIPASVTIGAGLSSSSFPVQIATVPETTHVTFTSTYAGYTTKMSLTVTP